MHLVTQDEPVRPPANGAAEAPAAGIEKDRRPTARVVVVSPAALVRYAIERRLGELDAEVTSTGDPTGLVLDDFDVVIMGPYVDPEKRERVAEILLRPGASRTATIVELADLPDPDSAQVVSLGDARTRILAGAVVSLLQAPDEAVALPRV